MDFKKIERTITNAKNITRLLQQKGFTPDTHPEDNDFQIIIDVTENIYLVIHDTSVEVLQNTDGEYHLVTTVEPTQTLNAVMTLIS